MKICKVEGCNNSSYYKDYGHRGYCNKHYRQIKKYGKIQKRTRHDSNEIIDCGDYYEICLYSGYSEQKEIARAKIDKEDLEKVKRYKWCLNDHKYVISKINNKTTKLHQLVMGKIVGHEIDHKFGNTLDNRKQNLRFVTRSQNQMNKKSRGYCWDKRSKKWMVRIEKNKKSIYLGLFINKQDAMTARKQAEQKYFGEFAYNY